MADGRSARFPNGERSAEIAQSAADGLEQGDLGFIAAAGRVAAAEVGELAEHLIEREHAFAHRH